MRIYEKICQAEMFESLGRVSDYDNKYWLIIKKEYKEKKQRIFNYHFMVLDSKEEAKADAKRPTAAMNRENFAIVLVVDIKRVDKVKIFEKWKCHNSG